MVKLFDTPFEGIELLYSNVYKKWTPREQQTIEDGDHWVDPSESDAFLKYAGGVFRLQDFKVKTQNVANYFYIIFTLMRSIIGTRLDSLELEALTCGNAFFVIETSQYILNRCRCCSADQHYGNGTIHVRATCPTVHYKDTCPRCTIGDNRDVENTKGDLEGSLILKKLFGKDI